MIYFPWNTNNELLRMLLIAEREKIRNIRCHLLLVNYGRENYQHLQPENKKCS